MRIGVGISGAGGVRAAEAARAEDPTGAEITGSWESLRDRVGAPRSVTDMVAGTAAAGPTWWLPSLAYLAHRLVERADARAVLDQLAARRDELRYAVVEERTDDVVGLSVQPWPLVDGQGRLRFPIGRDPEQVEVPAAGLTELLRAARSRWYELGLLQAELVARQVRIGDVYAVALFDRPAPGRLPALPSAAHPGGRHLGGLDAGDRPGSVAVPVVDVSWDAREAGKLAHHAAAAGVVTGHLDAASAAIVDETEQRYVVGFLTGVDPRDVDLPGPPA